MWENLKLKMRNKGFWIALVSAILLVASNVGFKIDNQWVMVTLNSVLGILAMLGIVSDPTKGDWFADPEDYVGKNIDELPVDEANEEEVVVDEEVDEDTKG